MLLTRLRTNSRAKKRKWIATLAYIPRTLVVDKLHPDERTIGEDEISTIQNPIIILGEPGIGKSDLSKSIAETLGAVRVSAGTFARSENLAPYEVGRAGTLVIDGLDEVSTSTGETALDVVLSKLDRLGRPRFILSCRAADWQGVANRWKIEQDYGLRPVTLQILPFNRQQARSFLDAYDNIEPDNLLEEIAERGLQELVGNPLTLGLLAAVAQEGKGIPDNKTELLNQASCMLVSELNPAHVGSPASQAPIEDLLLSAGAAMAHLLLSNMTGISTGDRQSIPSGFVHVSDFAAVPDAPHIPDALKTRLFRAEGEGLFVPLHRVIAEFWAAYWLAGRLQNGLSVRRLFQVLEFSGGVPGPLRGVHAWLANFSPLVADRCIRSDPYGVLRYGETDKLPASRAKLLLATLGALASEDPYFRSEDWGTKALSGLAKPELKDDIIAVVRSPQRHFHLSSLLLEALPGSTLTEDIVPQLWELIGDSSAAYVERLHAAEALIASSTDLEWTALVSRLTGGDTTDSRLALDISARLGGKGIAPEIIADALVAQLGIDRDDDNDDYAAGTDYTLVRRLPAARCSEVLDVLAARIAAKSNSPYWTPNHRISGAVQRLTAKVLEQCAVAPVQFWSWLRYIDARTSFSSDSKDEIANFLKANPTFRRGVQRVAFEDKTIEHGPWMAIVSELPQANPGLYPNSSDVSFFIAEMLDKDVLRNDEVTLWTDLVRSQGNPEKCDDAFRQLIEKCTAKHASLAEQWAQLTKPPVRDFEKEEQRRQAKYRRQQARKFASHRENFEKVKDDIKTGKAFGALHQLAHAHLNHYSDLNHEVDPVQRLREWVGEEVAEAALQGFVASLQRNDLPTIKQIIESRLEGKHWNIEPVLLCGISELVRSQRSLDEVSKAVAEALLAVWWEMPEFHSQKLGEDIEKCLEDKVFVSSESTEVFLTAAIEPKIAAGKDNISGLYRLAREARFSSLAARLSTRWLSKYPAAHISVQLELLRIALHAGTSPELITLINERLSIRKELSDTALRMWLSASFLLDLPDFRSDALAHAAGDKDILWSITDLRRPDDFENRSLSLSVGQLEELVATFAPLWPVVPRPTSGWRGHHEPHDATDFITGCITTLANLPTLEASQALDRLTSSVTADAYLERIKHARAQQRRLRRDKEYVPLTFQQTKQTLSDGLPGTIDDLRAMILDRLEDLQHYIRNAETDGWDAYWDADKPKNENTCRDRIVDALRPKLPMSIELIPENLMPEKNRCDIVASLISLGLPIEVKGQWHSEVWDASQTQLDDLYGRFWKADGRGVYVVLWFGDVPGKKLTVHPDGLKAPSSPQELREMLLGRLGASEKSHIDVFVLDVSKPKKFASKTTKPKKRSGKT